MSNVFQALECLFGVQLRSISVRLPTLLMGGIRARRRTIESWRRMSGGGAEPRTRIQLLAVRAAAALMMGIGGMDSPATDAQPGARYAEPAGEAAWVAPVAPVPRLNGRGNT